MSTKGPKSPADESLDPQWYVVLALLVGVLVYAFWYTAHEYIAGVYAAIRVGQFSLFVLSRTIWGAISGIVLIVLAVALTLKKEWKPYAKWAAIAGAYFVGEYAVTRFTVSAWGSLVGVAIMLIAYILGWVGPLKKYTGPVMMVGVLLATSGVVGGIFTSWFFFFLHSAAPFIEWSHLSKSSVIANVFTLFAVNLPLAFWVMRRSFTTNPTNHKHFGKTQDYTLHSFTDEQAKHYPHLKLFRKLDLTARPINSGKYRMADTEKYFAIKHRLLDRVDKGNEFKVNRDRAAEIFRRQMGRLWRSPKDLTKWEAAIIAALIPRIAALDLKMSEEDYKEALATTDRLVAQYWADAGESYDPNTDKITIDMDDALSVLRKYWNHTTVRPYFKRHAYVYTLIYAMLGDARRLGVLPANEFRWLRVADRRLWLMVDNVGRITAFTEVAGIYSHFLHETKAKRSIDRPAIEAAIKGLVEGVDSYKFTEEEIEQINDQLRDTEEKPTVDPKAVAKEKQTLVLGALVVKSPERNDLIDVAILSEKGEVVYQQICKPQVAVEYLRDQHGIGDEHLAKIVAAPTSAAVVQKVLEVVNGHALVAFYGDELPLFPGIERSAASVRVLQDPDEPESVQAAVMMEGIVQQTPAVNSAEDCARLVRELWLKAREAEMRAEAQHQSSGAKNSN
ncbi:hypothetical protein [Burkholderia sp. Tr-20390]|uniref:secretion/conjugation apparatus DotM-related subunit n=1 Tax=Burkholderia sp. Tr-20390 TaxID=2703904 RepID=UPI00197D9239|nr:hypothetical protein [Burkholderia sp. Tr-20390]MBN3729418.1 hypothetical protein [Burkholderia sp. Tr-20390]